MYGNTHNISTIYNILFKQMLNLNNQVDGEQRAVVCILWILVSLDVGLYRFYLLMILYNRGDGFSQEDDVVLIFLASCCCCLLLHDDAIGCCIHGMLCLTIFLAICLLTLFFCRLPSKLTPNTSNLMQRNMTVE
jgi:hypothetical protein